MDQRPIAELKNLGPVTAQDLAQVGVETHAQLQEVGPVDAWLRLNALRPKQYTLVGLYALAGALLDKEWKDLPAEYRTQLREEAARSGRSKSKRSRAPAGGSQNQTLRPSNVASGH
jgi:DNA transformation protein and related proteins